jgi:hypothetical protein
LKPTNAVIWVNGERRNNLAFWEPLRSLEVRIASSDEKVQRTMTLSLTEIFAAKLHPTPTWRLEYPFAINCAPPQCPGASTVELQLLDGKFDDDFEEELTRAGMAVSGHTNLQIKLSDVTKPVPLLAGDYRIRLLEPCTADIDTFSVPKDLSYDIAHVCQ